MTTSFLQHNAGPAANTEVALLLFKDVLIIVAYKHEVRDCMAKIPIENQVSANNSPEW